MHAFGFSRGEVLEREREREREIERERERRRKKKRTRVWSAFEILKYYLKSQVYVPVKVTCNVFFRVLYFYWLRLLRKLNL